MLGYSGLKEPGRGPFRFSQTPLFSTLAGYVLLSLYPNITTRYKQGETDQQQLTHYKAPLHLQFTTLFVLSVPIVSNPFLRSAFRYVHLRLQSMASITAPSVSFTTLSFKQSQVATRFSGVSVSVKGRSFPSLTAQNLKISCAAKPETVDKVCEIVKKQLALPADTPVTGESKFAALGADSLDTVEIVMGLEEEFGISVEEESAQTIATVQDAADMIEKLLEK
ncbi:unnamed protein product [Rhodiola kirilowii]